MTTHDIPPEVSIIIPCYNQGKYILETLDSALSQTLDNYEVIIVNDGSDDENTTRVLNNIKDNRVTIITTKNQGLASARNNGILASTGKYILPLDADDKIKPTYLEKSVNVLKQNKKIGIVYCRAALFGDTEGEWLLPKYSLQGILLENMIFCSALFRREDWEKVGGYDSGMVYGWEDYDFWLSLIERGKDVFRIDEILFYYRVSENSMVRSKGKWQKSLMFKRIFERHKNLFENNIEVWIDALHQTREEYNTALLYIDTGNGINEKEIIARKINLETKKLSFDLKTFKNIQSLHFAPLDSQVVVTIAKIIFKDEKNKEQEILPKKLFSNAIKSEKEKKNMMCFYFHTDAPRIQIKDIKGFIPIQLTIELSYHAIKEYALLKIIESSNTKTFTFNKIKKIFNYN